MTSLRPGARYSAQEPIHCIVSEERQLEGCGGFIARWGRSTPDGFQRPDSRGRCAEEELQEFPCGDRAAVAPGFRWRSPGIRSQSGSTSPSVTVRALQEFGEHNDVRSDGGLNCYLRLPDAAHGLWPLPCGSGPLVHAVPGGLWLVQSVCSGRNATSFHCLCIIIGCGAMLGDL